MAPEIAVLELQVTLNGHQFFEFFGVSGAESSRIKSAAFWQVLGFYRVWQPVPTSF
jgi:hypothetical protein